MYNNIDKQVKIAIEENQKLLLLGDFNCKVGTVIKGNAGKITKGGRILLKMIDRNQLYLVNADERCQGVFTRSQGQDLPSVLDYAIIRNVDTKDIKSMIIDEEGEMKMHYFFKDKDNETKEMTTDHETLLIEMDYMISMEKCKTKEIITEKGYEKYRIILSERKVSDILEGPGDFQTKYSKWEKMVEECIKESTSILKKRNPRKEVQNLYKIRKGIKKDMKYKKKDEKLLIKYRLEMINSHILNINKKSRADTINKITEELKDKNREKGPKIWEIKRKLQKKTENATSLVKFNGTSVEEKEKILDEYTTYFSNLLVTKKARTENEISIEEEVNKEFEKIITNAKSQQPQEISEKVVEEVIVKMKEKKLQIEEVGKLSGLKKEE